jgi:TatD DNase family protein
MTLVDTHCHVQDPAFDPDRDAVLERALDHLSWLIVVGDTLETSRAAVELARDRVFVAVGVHPYDADQLDENQLAEIRSLAQQPNVVAIGETGLDFHYATASRAAQERAFREQVELACELDLPVIVHNRNADEPLAAMLEAMPPLPAGGVMHCFSGDAAFAERCLHWGFYISFAGNVTFPKAASLRESARAVPLDRMLVETDSPHLAPQPVRGKRCEPAYLRYTAEALAALKGLTPEAFALQTSENARRLFKISVPRLLPPA